eukprot:5624824-Prymnesium_polylepis.1
MRTMWSRVKSRGNREFATRSEWRRPQLEARDAVTVSCTRLSSRSKPNESERKPLALEASCGGAGSEMAEP